MKKIILGIIGLGTVFQRKHLPSLCKLKDKFDIKYIWTSDKKKFNSVQHNFKHMKRCCSIKDLLSRKDVDAIVACVPLPKHYEVVKKVLSYKHNLLIEKPMMHNVDCAKKIMYLLRKNNARMMVSENFRYLSSIGKVKNIIDKNKLGKIKLVQIKALTLLDERSPYYGKHWRINPKTYPGILWEGGVHFVSILRYLFESVEWKYKKLLSINPELGKHDTLFTYAKVKKNIDAFINISYSIKQDDDFFLKVYGTNGNVQCSMSSLLVDYGTRASKYVFKFDEYERIYKEFYNFIINGHIPGYCLNDAYRDLKILDKLLNVRG